jgi:hypothetical protein
LNKRKSARIKTVLPVKMCIDTGTAFVHTVDITDTGAQLGGVRTRLEPGMIVSLRRGSHKAKFRIAWVRQLAPNELRAGIECLEPQKNFWEVNRPNTGSDAEQDANAIMTIQNWVVRSSYAASADWYALLTSARQRNHQQSGIAMADGIERVCVQSASLR